MTFLYVLGSLSVLSAVLSGYFNVKEKAALRLMMKTAASLLFLLLGIAATAISGTYKSYAILVICALIFGLLGDIFLAVNTLATERGQKVFNAMGLTTFTVGHGFFIYIFLSGTHFNFYLLPLLLILPIALTTLVKMKIIKAGKFNIAFIAYSFILGLMAVSTVNLYINEPSSVNAMVLAAGLLFAASDCSLVIRSYSNLERRKVNYLIFVVLITYYVAQVLFALTIVFH